MDRADKQGDKPVSASGSTNTGLAYELLSFFLLLLPFAITNGIVVVKSIDLPLYGGKIVLFVLPISFLLFQLWKKSRVIKVITFLLALLAGAEAYIAYQFGGVSGSSVFSILTSSDMAESLGYAMERWQLISLWLLLCAVSTTLAWYVARRSRFRAGGFLCLSLLCLAAYGWYLGAMSASLYQREKNANRFPVASTDAKDKLFGVGHLPPLLSTIRDTFPYGLPVRLWMYNQEEKFMRSMEEQTHAFRFGAYSVGPRPVQETYVLVLGESARFDRWSVNGYGRDTSPNLLKARQSGELASMQDMLTARAFTMGSVPIYLTGRDTMREGATQKSLISAFKEAGFKTYFLSTQIKKSFLNNVTALFAAEADMQQYFEADEALGLVHDEALLLPFMNILQEKAARKLIVLHTMGSHAVYTARYPKAHEKFQPVSDAKKGGFGDPFDSMQGISNAYDNSIRYADHVMGQIMQALAGLDGYAVMVYGSDHGQTLPTPQCKFIGHGVMNIETLHVPYFVWSNKAYRQAHAEQWQQLLNNQEKPVMTSANFATMLDLADIRYTGFPSGKSLLASHQPGAKRMVTDMQNTEFDLDTSTGKGSNCGLLHASIQEAAHPSLRPGD